MSWERAALSIATVFTTLDDIIKPWVKVSERAAKELIEEDGTDNFYDNLAVVLKGLLGDEEQRNSTIKNLTDMAKNMSVKL